MKKEPTLGLLITTMDNGIERVIQELLPQLNNVDEVIISHQILDKNILPKKGLLGKNVKYVYMNEKGLSKNRNNALKYSKTDICHICDDDLNYIKGFEEKIKKLYKNTNYDIITFQAEDYKGKKHFNINEGKHGSLSVLKVHSIGITFSRKKIIENNIYFDTLFGLGSTYPVGEENIFLNDCYEIGLRMYHSEKSIVRHPIESSGTDYREELIIARIKVFKRLYGNFVAFLFIFYFAIFHYRLYKEKFGIVEFLKLSLEGFKR